MNQKKSYVDSTAENIPLITDPTSFVPTSRTYPGNMFMQSKWSEKIIYMFKFLI